MAGRWRRASRPLIAAAAAATMSNAGDAGTGTSSTTSSGRGTESGGSRKEGTETKAKTPSQSRWVRIPLIQAASLVGVDDMALHSPCLPSHHYCHHSFIHHHHHHHHHLDNRYITHSCLNMQIQLVGMFFFGPTKTPPLTTRYCHYDHHPQLRRPCTTHCR